MSAARSGHPYLMHDAIYAQPGALRLLTRGQSATLTAAAAALAGALGHDDDLGRRLDALPDQLAFLLGQESWEDLARRFGGRRRYWVVGAGPNTATALEGALKLNEAAWIPALGFNAEQFLHGPWAAMEPDDALFLI